MKDLMTKGRIERRADVTESFLTSLHEQYDTAIRHTAEELGKFFARLDEAGLLDDALLVLTSDHGEELFDHGGFAHRYSLYREILRVPLFVKLPGQRKTQVIAEPVGLTDVHATLLHALGLERSGSDAADGRSLLPFLEPELTVPESLRDRAFVALATNPKRCVGRAVRKGRHTLIEVLRSYQDDRPHTELYDLAVDPGERRDLSRAEPALGKELHAVLQERHEELSRDALPALDYPLSEHDRASLEALGYGDDGRSAPDGRAEGEQSHSNGG
jgi:arylsulfatase A-like enzyme